MIVNEEVLEATNVQFEAWASEGMENSEVAAEVDLLSMNLPSNQEKQQYNWFGAVPSMRKWVGDRVAQAIGAQKYELENERFEATVGVHENDFIFDRIGQLRPKVMGMGAAATYHQHELLVALINAGWAGLCYDGKAFFAADHAEGKSGAQSNTDTAVCSHDAVYTHILKMRKFKNDQGRLMYCRPTHLWGAAALEGVIDDICNNKYRVATATIENTLKGRLKPLILDGLDDDKYWGLADLSKPVKPLVRQKVALPGANADGIRFMSLDFGSEGKFRRLQSEFGVDYMGNAGYAFWQLMTGSTGAGS